MKKHFLITILLINFSLIRGAYYFIYSPTNILDTNNNLNNNAFIATSDGIYKKNEYYELVYNFEKKVQQGLFLNNIFHTPNYKYIIGENKIIRKKSKEKLPFKKEHHFPKITIKEKINSHYLIEDLNKDQKKEIIFTHQNKIVLGEIQKDTLVKKYSAPYKITVDNNKLRIKYAGKDYLFKKNKKNQWIENKLNNTEKIQKEMIQDKTADELELLRYTILAKHGKKFNNKKIQHYFEKQPWYQPSNTFQENNLSDNEIYNLNLLFNLESQKRRKGLKEHEKPQLPQ